MAIKLNQLFLLRVSNVQNFMYFHKTCFLRGHLYFIWNDCLLFRELFECWPTSCISLFYHNFIFFVENVIFKRSYKNSMIIRFSWNNRRTQTLVSLTHISLTLVLLKTHWNSRHPLVSRVSFTSTSWSIDQCRWTVLRQASAGPGNSTSFWS